MLNRSAKAVNPAATSKIVAQPQTEPDITGSSPARYAPSSSEIVGKTKRAIFNRYSLIILGLALVCITIAYQFRPVIYVNLGGGYDLPYLDKFAGEVRPELNPNQSGDITDTETPATQGKLDPAIVLDAAGKRLPEPVIDNYRWSTARSIVLLPGVGSAPSKLTLRAAASPLYPQGQKVQVLLNGQDFTAFEVKPGVPTSFVFNFGAERYQSGNMAVEFRVSPIGAMGGNITFDAKSYYKDGFKLYDLWLEQQPGGFIMPEPKTAAALAISSLALFVLLAYCGLAKLIAFGVATAFTLAYTVILSVWRLELAVFNTRLVLLLAFTGVMLIVFDLTLPRLFKNWNLPLPRKAWQWLMILFLVGMVIRGGGTLYPQTVVIDQPYHLNVISKVLDEPGGLFKVYSDKDPSKVPGHWTASGIIPYSPFVHFYLSPIAALPIERAVTVNLANIFLDATRVLLIYALALALGASVGAALVGAALYLLIPCTYLLNSWGNWPTTVSFWMALLYLVLVLVNYERLNKRGLWIGLTVLLTLTMLAYSVTMVFMGMIVYIWAAGLFWFTGRKDPAERALARRNAKLVFAQVNVAAVAAVAIYYWQFISDIIPTINSFDSSLTSGQGLGLEERGFFSYLGLYTDHVFISYGVGVFLLLSLAVLVWGIRERSAAKPELQLNTTDHTVAKKWYAWGWMVMIFFWGVTQWKVDMVDKHVWFTVPLIAALAGTAMLNLWQGLPALVRNGKNTVVAQWAGRLAVAVLVGWLSYSAMSLWIYRIFFKRH